ncbi:MAG TPA: tetratricopeptide repeat protein [Candidatus Acidoferrales bacterium]|jgi:tetratricopeptide (TPR) repeat protein|nr:tetratricopeptide repeat protein [Candidatus Acidoferrales bacterium]
MTPAIRKSLLKYLVCSLLAGVTLAAFARVGRCSFIVLDDGAYVLDHSAVQQGLSLGAVKWAFSTFDCSNWHPLTWLSHIVDFQLYGLAPSGYHLTNLAFHIANTVLLFLLLEVLTSRLWPSAFAALLFGIHPMHVESVAWISERKDVLSGFFFMLTLIAYARYAQLSSTNRQSSAPKSDGGGSAIRSPQSRWLAYCLALFFCALGLMSKPMLVTLPFVLLMLDLWPLQRFDSFTAPNQSESRSTFSARRSAAKTGQRLLVEKIPFLVLSAASCCLTWLAQNAGGAIKMASKYPLAERLGQVPVSYAWYLLKCFWPVDLSIFNPLRVGGSSHLLTLTATLLLLAPTLFAVAGARKYGYFLVGWLWFIGMLVPVIGLVQVGSAAYADRYTYLPYIGLFLIIAWGVPELLAKAPCRRLILGAGFGLVTVGCLLQTVREVGYWRNGIVLFSRAVALDPQNEFAWAMLGSEYSWHGDDSKAQDCIQRALTLNPRLGPAWHYLGRILIRKNDLPGAEQAFRSSLENTSLASERIDLFSGLGNVLATEGKDGDAAAAYRSSLELSPDQPGIQTKLGRLLFHDRKFDQAAVAFENAIRLKPDDDEAHFSLGLILQGKGRDSEAIAQYRRVVEVSPNSVAALNNLAWLLAADSDPALRNGTQAVALAEHACQLNRYQVAQVVGTLAAAYAEAGRFDDAVAAAQKAHDIALTAGDNQLTARNAKLMELYKAHKAFHMGANQ